MYCRNRYEVYVVNSLHSEPDFSQFVILKVKTAPNRLNLPRENIIGGYFGGIIFLRFLIGGRFEHLNCK